MNELLTVQRSPVETVRNAVEEFVYHPSLLTIAERFGFNYDNSSEGYLEALQGFAQEHWDYRAGTQQRADTNWPTFEADTADLVRQSIGEISLISAETASNKHYTIGAGFGCRGETAYRRVAQLLKQYRDGVTFDRIVLLGSERPVDDRERQELHYPPTVTTEYELMNAVFESICASEGMSATIHSNIGAQTRSASSWHVREYELDGGTPVFSLSSDFRAHPDGSPKKRANTRDTLAFMRTIAGEELHSAARILGVTSGPSIVYQHLLALEELTLPTGAVVEMIGCQESANPAYLLQEVVKAGLDHALSAQRATEMYQPHANRYILPV